ncbi:Delta-like protein 4-like, partial [Homarus americanus]
VPSLLVCVLQGRAWAGGGKGVLRVRVTSFRNDLSRDVDGECCLNPRGLPGCSSHCRTFFRVCATHPGRRQPPTSITTAARNLSSILADATHAHTRPHSPSPMPHALRVGGRGWGRRSRHVRGSTGRGGATPQVPYRVGQLIARHVGHHRVEGGRAWSHHAHTNAHTTLNYSLKVICATPYQGSHCSQ